MFDFEWLNKQLFRGLYARTESFFDRSELSSHGVPADGRERELLAPYASQLAPGALEGTFSQPTTDGTGTNRDGRKEAIALLSEAGYELKHGAMTASATGRPFTFELLCVTREQQRLMLAYAAALRQIGIGVQVRMIHSAQFQRRSTSFDFDVMPASWGSSLSPGNEQSFRWSAAAADEEGSYNFAGVKSKGVDAMIAAMLNANTREDFVSAVRALDRLLLSGRYGIPLYYAPKQWIAAWSHLRQPPGSTLYGARLEPGGRAMRKAQRRAIQINRCPTCRCEPGRRVPRLAFQRDRAGFRDIDMLLLVVHELFEEVAAHIVFDGMAMGGRLLVERTRLEFLSRSHSRTSFTDCPICKGWITCRLGKPSRNMMRSVSLSACSISSMELPAPLLGKLLVAPIIEKPVMQPSIGLSRPARGAGPY